MESQSMITGPLNAENLRAVIREVLSDRKVVWNVDGYDRGSISDASEWENLKWNLTFYGVGVALGWCLGYAASGAKK